MENFETIIVKMKRNPASIPGFQNLVLFLLYFLKFPDLMYALVWINYLKDETFVGIALSSNV